jgi:hypothetical protein
MSRSSTGMPARWARCRRQAAVARSNELERDAVDPGHAAANKATTEGLLSAYVGRPVARMLPQDGTWGEITRFVLLPGLPYGTASEVLRFAVLLARTRRCPSVIIAYHDRTRHTGCIYRKAGFRKDGVSGRKGGSWATRDRPKSGAYEGTPKRSWRIDIAESGTEAS